MKPMLAFRYDDPPKRRFLTFPCHIQPKLNGIRMLYMGGLMQSRSYGQIEPKTWALNRLAHIREELSEWPRSIFLDGELYNHGWSLQRINGAAAVNALTDRSDCSQLSYHIFDCYSIAWPEASFADRWDLVSQYFRDRIRRSLKLVDTRVILSETDGTARYDAVKKEGYEGLMYRQSAARYGLAENCGNKENRWSCLLKRKGHMDGEYRVINIVEGEGKYVGLVGSLRFCHEGKFFTAGSGLSDDQRREFMESPPIGRLVRVNYEMLSDDGVPLQPRIECFIDE